ncbi:MAG: GLUG motif-containing protein, partial [Candidatus Omnitrophica bacterium]|nr:GLUG motif-containing protein [Candidatus Omnitrophota bacterium]
MTAVIFAWTMICPLGFAETINLEGGSIEVNVQDNITNWNVQGNPIWNMPEFNVAEGSIYNIAGLGSGASLALLVNGGSASNIFGTMNLSNLDFILQNISGINIGGSAMINLNNASLIASTLPLNLGMTDFLKRNYQFSGEGGFLSNEGRIIGTNADLVAFVASAMENKGTIEVPMGTVALAAGNTVTVGISADGLVSIGVDEATANTLGLSDQIKNSGTIQANGGKVILNAQAVDGLYDKAINIERSDKAITAIQADNGTIEFKSMDDIYNDAILQAMKGEIKVTSTAGKITNAGTMDVGTAGKIKMEAAGDIKTQGVLRAGHLEESGASFQIGGVYSIGSSSHDNLDQAITFTANATIDGHEDGSSVDYAILSDDENIVINSGVTLTLGGNFVFNADADNDGTGAFLMNAGATIAGAGYDLTLRASDNSTVGVVSNVGTLTLARNATDADITYTSSTAVDDIGVVTFKTESSTATGVKFLKTVGSGAADDPYLVYDITQLQAMGTNATTLSKSYTLANNIDASSTTGWNAGAGFDPVGDSTNKYSGTFAGADHTITNLTINRSAESDVGLFGRTNGATIKDVGLVNVSAKGTNRVGGLVGLNYKSSIDNSYVTGNVTGTGDYIGGLAGINRYTRSSFGISNSYSTSDVTGGRNAGGLVGYNYDSASISNSYATGIVTGISYIGGLVGRNYNSASVSNSHATGSVTGTATSIGGLVGYNTKNASVSDSYATGLVTGNSVSGNYVGGLVGWNYDYSSISNSYATGDVTGNYRIGGFVGQNDYHASIDNGYATGTVTGTTQIGGFVGYNYLSSTIANSHATGSATGTSDYVGGLVGRNTAAISDSYATGNATGASFVGGLAGNNTSTIANSYAMGNVSGSGDVGGLVGQAAGSSISESYATGSVTGTGNNVGGLVGYNYASSSISRSYATGNVTGASAVGGFVGSNGNSNLDGFSTISDSYATGSVTGTGNQVGGLVGSNSSDPYVTSSATISNSYATGSVTGADYVGGLVGSNYSFYSYSAAISNCYATGSVTGTGDYVGGFLGDNERAPLTNNWWFSSSEHGIGGGEEAGVTKATSASDFFGTGSGTGGAVYSGWDFATVWQSVQSSNPLLKWEVNIWTAAVSNLWSNAANWSKGVAPTAGSTVLFNSTSLEDSTIDAGFAGSVNKLYIDTGYTGTITQDSSLAVVGVYSQAAGIFTDASPASHTFTVGGSFSIPTTDDSFMRYTGTGTALTPYVIRDVYDLQAMQQDLDAHYQLNNSIDAASTSGWHSGDGFDPIGDLMQTFIGVLNGFGKVISNLKVNRTSTDYVGLFGKIGSGGLVSELGLEKVSAYGRDYVGGLAGLNQGTLSNVYTTGSFTVSGVNFIGGLVGGNTGSIANAYSSARVVGTNKVGGLAGSNTGTIQHTYAMGHVTGTTNTGGLVGTGDSSKVTSSFWNEKMTGQETSAGGTAGKVVRVTDQVEDGYAVLNAEDLADPNADMMLSSTFSGWDFKNTWVLDEGGSFPHFQFRYPEGVRGVWGITYNYDNVHGTLTPVGDADVGLYVNTNPLDMTGLGTQRDLTKSTADGMYYFVLGQNDVQATDWVIGKIENN